MTGTMPKLAKSEQERFSNVFERQIWWIMTSAKLYTLCQRYLCNKKYAVMSAILINSYLLTIYSQIFTYRSINI